MKISLRQLLIGFVALAAALGVVMAFWDQRNEDAVILGFAVVSGVLLYCVMVPSSVDGVEWRVAKHWPIALSGLIVFLVWCGYLIWSAS